MPTGDIDWNPGDNDPSVGGAIADSLGRTITATPRGSPARKELQRRWDYLWAAVGRLEYGEPTGNWWDGPSKLDLTSSASQLALNETVGAASMTHGCYSNDCDGDATVA